MAICLAGLAPAHAQDWEPFKDRDERCARSAQRADVPPTAPRRRARARLHARRGDASSLPPLSASAATMERSDPQAIPASEASGFSAELWQSPTRRRSRLIWRASRSQSGRPPFSRFGRSCGWPPTARRAGPGRAGSPLATGHTVSLRPARQLARRISPSRRPRVVSSATAAEARARIGLGDHERGCAKIRSVVRQISELPKLARADALLISGYCAVVEKNTPAASVGRAGPRPERGRVHRAGRARGPCRGSRPEANVPGPDFTARLSLPGTRRDRRSGRRCSQGRRSVAGLLAIETASMRACGRRPRSWPASPMPSDAELLAEVYRAARFDAGSAADAASATCPRI